MTKTATSFTALLVALSVSGAAFAQEATTGGTEFGTDMETGVDDVGASETETMTEITADSDLMARTGLTFEDVLVAMQVNGDNTVALDGLADFSTGGEVVVVTVSELGGAEGQNAAALEQTLASRQATLPELQAAVAANATARNAIQDEGYLAENVVAVQPLENGWMVIVVDAPF